MDATGGYPRSDMTPGEVSEAIDKLRQQLISDLSVFPRDQAIYIITHSLTLREMHEMVAKVRRISSVFF